MNNNPPAIETKELCKSYDQGKTVALNHVSISLQQGKIYALTGSSGCGKSTLLNILGTLDNADSGAVLYFGKRKETIESISQFRRDHIGFIFQFHYLIPILTLQENVASAILFQKNSTVIQRQKQAEALLSSFGLEHKCHALSSNVSGGERQRAAIARALANEPKIILADEPTGNVDSKNTRIILQKLREYADLYNSMVLIATHDRNVAEFADCVLNMEDGRILSRN